MPKRPGPGADPDALARALLAQAVRHFSRVEGLRLG
jgi:hypothetical protein